MYFIGITTIFSPISGILFTSVIKKIGPGPCIMFGSVVGSIGILISAFASSIWTIVVCVGAISGTFLFVYKYKSYS